MATKFLGYMVKVAKIVKRVICICIYSSCDLTSHQVKILDKQGLQPGGGGGFPVATSEARLRKPTWKSANEPTLAFFSGFDLELAEAA